MTTATVTSILLASLAVGAGAPAAAEQVTAAPLGTVGILPFDLLSSRGGAYEAAAALPKALYLEMLRGQRLTPRLLQPALGMQPPIPIEEAARLGREAGVDLVVTGTVIEAETGSASHGASTGGLLGGIGLGGRLHRSKASVRVEIQVVEPTTSAIVRLLPLEGRSKDFSLGTSVYAGVGSIDLGGDWTETPMAKALFKVAQDLCRELVAQLGNEGKALREEGRR